MQVKSIAECSKGSILQYFWPSLSYHLSLNSVFCLILSGRLHRFYCTVRENWEKVPLVQVYLNVLSNERTILRTWFSKILINGCYGNKMSNTNWRQVLPWMKTCEQNLLFLQEILIKWNSALQTGKCVLKVMCTKGNFIYTKSDILSILAFHLDKFLNRSITKFNWNSYTTHTQPLQTLKYIHVKLLGRVHKLIVQLNQPHVITAPLGWDKQEYELFSWQRPGPRL